MCCLRFEKHVPTCNCGKRAILKAAYPKGDKSSLGVREVSGHQRYYFACAWGGSRRLAAAMSHGARGCAFLDGSSSKLDTDNLINGQSTNPLWYLVQATTRRVRIFPCRSLNFLFGVE